MSCGNFNKMLSPNPLGFIHADPDGRCSFCKEQIVKNIECSTEKPVYFSINIDDELRPLWALFLKYFIIGLMLGATIARITLGIANQ